MKFHSIILAGGSGTRLWPLSRKKMPKQFLNLTEERSLLKSTIDRLFQLSDTQKISIICNQEHKFLVADQAKEYGLENFRIIVEPASRNTAIAMYIATLQALESIDDESTVFLTVPSDHLIKDGEGFKQTIIKASKIADEGRLVTLGIKPDKPSTSFGYIKKVAKEKFKIKEFVEKPDIKTAQEFLDDGNYLWNSGMFIYKANTFLNELEKYESKVIEYGKQSLNLSKINGGFIELDKESFIKSPNISIDYALMEKTEKASVVEMESDWSDLGSFDQLFEVLPKDDHGNHIKGDVLSVNTNNSYIHSKSKLITTLGVKDLTIIDTDDALLVSDRQNATSEDLKSILNSLNLKNRNEVDDNRKVIRPWGWYDSLLNNSGFQVKHICVNSHSSISLQRHKYRAEHWIVVKGVGLITLGEEKIVLNENESIFIPQGTIHRLENNSEDPVEIIEVQYGDYLGEDDIERFEDIFGRK